MVQLPNKYTICIKKVYYNIQGSKYLEFNAQYINLNETVSFRLYLEDKNGREINTAYTLVNDLFDLLDLNIDESEQDNDGCISMLEDKIIGCVLKSFNNYSYLVCWFNPATEQTIWEYKNNTKATYVDKKIEKLKNNII